MKKVTRPIHNKKDEQLKEYTACHDKTELNTNQGVSVADTDNSLKAGKRGPTLLEDFMLREKVTHFDHERIPERVVHARGFGAHGEFQVYESMAKLTKAKFLSDPSVKTPVFARFSTVAGSRGSADTVRDVRGFAVKFYTEEGNYDLVGNNMPVFFIQDAMKFPDFVHAVKPEPDNEMPQAASAHDTFWDFVVSTPETAHMVMWLMSDRALPRSYRMMEGFGVNTFRFVNAEGTARFVKFHWKPLLGMHSLVWDETQKIAGKNPDFNRRDLWDAIENGDFPEWEFGIQVIEEKDEFKFPFDILDPTKLWPEELVPVQRIGKMTLNRNVTNFFAETEQVAFCPANIVPGIDFSEDPLLQGRIFSYLDTQLSRLGGPNFQEIPINKSIVPIHNNQRDGIHRMRIDMGKTSYFPNNMADNHPHPAGMDFAAYKNAGKNISPVKVRMRSESFSDFFSQATLFWNSMSKAEKKHIVDAFRFELGNVTCPVIRQKAVDMFNNVDGELSVKIAAGIGSNPPANPKKTRADVNSPALSMSSTVKSPATRKVAVLAENGYNNTDAVKVLKALKTAGVCYEVVSSKIGELTSAEGMKLMAAKTFLTASPVLYDAVYVVGGRQSADALCMIPECKCFIDEMFKHCKAIGANAEGVDVINGTDIKGVTTAANSSSSDTVTDCGIVTVRKASGLNSFNTEFIAAIAAHRHWCRYELFGR